MVDIGRIYSLLLEDQQSSVFHFNFYIYIFFAYFHLLFEVHQSHIFRNLTRIDTDNFNVVWKCSRSPAGRPGWLFAPQSRA